MITFPLIFWFFAPFLLGAAIGGAVVVAGFTVIKIAESIINSIEPNKVQHVPNLNKIAAETIKKTLNEGNYSTSKGFLANDNDNKTILGTYNEEGIITDATYVDYNYIDTDMNNVLRKKEVLTW